MGENVAELKKQISNCKNAKQNAKILISPPMSKHDNKSVRLTDVADFRMAD